MLNARSLVVVAWIAAAVLLSLGLSLAEPKHRLEYVRVEPPGRMPLWVVLHVPDSLSGPAPAAVLVQPLNNVPEAARLLALELVQDGFVVLVFDWRGHAPGENRQVLTANVMDVMRADVVTAAAYLRTRPEVDPQRVFLAGHSVGGTLAIEAAVLDPRVAGVAAVGIEADVAPDEPRNLLWAVGLYDEFRHLNRMRETFRQSAPTAAEEGTTVGDFSRGTARRLGVSPTADHFTEFLDRNIHREVVAWFRQAAALPPSPRRYWMEPRHVFLLLAWLAALFGGVLAVRGMTGEHRWRLRLVALAALAGVVLLSYQRSLHYLHASGLVFWLLLLAVLGSIVSSLSPESLARVGRVFVRVAVVLWASLLLTLGVNNIASYVHQPRYLLSLPEFAVRHPLDGLLAYLFIYPLPLLFSSYSPETLAPRWWVYGLLGLEALWPGVWLALGTRLARRRPRAEARPRRPVVTLVILALLLAALGGMVSLRLAQGFLTGESALAALRFLLRYTVLPVFFFALLWRLWPRRTSR
jgi:dienelactone hydrolase